jgi:glycerophosphoryl diester phosphodiesterase
VATRPLVLAHRGASRAAAENTLVAFALARDAGADGVELDVRRTADDVLVVHHDPSADGFGLIARRPFADLRRARPEVPTLAESLAGCAGLLVNVEVKCLPWEPDPDPPDRPVLRAVIAEVRAHAPGSVISSFDLDALDACRALAPELATAWLTAGQDPVAAAATAAARGHGWLHPDRAAVLRDPGAAITAAHALGLRVDVWTVDDPDEIRALAGAGVDAIITNVPDIALAVLDGP